VTSSPSSKGVKVELRESVAVVSLARGEAMNAINDAIRTGLVDACRQVAGDPAIGAMVIQAEGERAFCVGADIKEQRVPLAGTAMRLPSADLDYTSAIAAIDKPVVVAIHGFCLGAGLEIALCGDVRIASACARFALPEVDLALIPGAGGTQRLPRLIGAGRAMDMMLTGERIDAQRALDWGLVTRLVGDRSQLAEAAFELARLLAVKAPLAVRYLKEAVRDGLDGSLAAGLRRERDLFTLLSATSDKAEAAEAFKAKRQATFQGR
jgi:enoyl-CoA hydratase/carnithine racemase